MQGEFKEKLMRWFTIAMIIVIVTVGLVCAYTPYRNGEALKKRDAELLETIETKKREIARLQENQRRFRTDPDFVETIARQNRRVFPGELVFVFDD